MAAAAHDAYEPSERRTVLRLAMTPTVDEGTSPALVDDAIRMASRLLSEGRRATDEARYRAEFAIAAARQQAEHELAQARAEAQRIVTAAHLEARRVLDTPQVETLRVIDLDRGPVTPEVDGAPETLNERALPVMATPLQWLDMTGAAPAQRGDDVACLQVLPRRANAGTHRHARRWFARTRP